MTNIIPFTRQNTGLPLTFLKLHNVKNEDDVLEDRNIHLMMQAYHSSGVYQSMVSHSTVEQSGRLPHTYAEQMLTEEQLLPFAIRTPTRTICAPVKIEIVDSSLFQYLDNNRNAHRAYIKASCAWFFGQDISKGLLSMLMGNQSDRMVEEIDEIVWMLERHGALIKTNLTMSQPVQPNDIVFSEDEHVIFRASRKTLYRDIEKVMFLLDALSEMPALYGDTVCKWASKPWPGLNKPPAIAPVRINEDS